MDQREAAGPEASGPDGGGPRPTLLRGFAHELRNLLGVFINGGELLADELGPEALHGEVAATLHDMRRAGERARGLLARLTDLSALEGMEAEAVDVSGLVADLAPRLEALCAGRHLAVSLSGDGPRVGGTAAVFEGLLLDLVDNAARASVEGARIGVDVSVVPAPPVPVRRAGPWILLQVSDEGAGMDPVTAARAFEPFFTTARGRWGVGLSMVQAAVAALGGQVRLETHRGRGTSVSVWLPPKTVERRQPAGQVAVHSDAHGGPAALVVDDDPARCTVVKRILEGVGLRVLAASHPEVGLLLFEQQEGSVDLVVVPGTLPGIAPADLVRDLKGRRPEMRVLHLRGAEDGPLPAWADAEVPRAVEAARVQAAVAALLPGRTDR